MSARTIRCPKAQANHYFFQACETIIIPGNTRSWCKYCYHFAVQDEAVPEKTDVTNAEAKG